MTPEDRVKYRASMTRHLEARITKNKKFLEWAAAFDLVWRGDEIAGVKPFGHKQAVTLAQASAVSEKKGEIEDDLEYCEMLKLALQDEWDAIDIALGVAR